MPVAPTGLLAWLVLPFLAVTGDPPQRLSIGTEARASLTPGAFLEYEVVREKAGSVCIELSSLDFDAALEASNAKGPIAITSNEGVETDEVATLDLPAGEALRLRVRAADGRSGEFVLRALERGTTLDERWKLHVHGLEDRARRMLESGEPRSAAGFSERAGRLCRRSGALQAARAHFERQVGAAEKSGDRRSIARGRVLLGSIQSSLGDLRSGLDTLVAANTDSSDLEPEDQLILLQALGFARFGLGEREAGFELLASAVELARKLGTKEQLALALARQAFKLTEARRLDKAEGSLTEAGRLAAEIKDPAVRAEVLSAKARWLQEGARWRDALRIGQEALDLEPAPTTRFLILGTMADVHEKLDELEEAHGLGRESQKLCDSLGVQGYEDEYLMLFGNIFLKGNDPQKARGLLERALEIQVERNEPEKQLETLLSLASACYRLADVEGQRGSCERALELAARLKAKRGECRASYLLGRALQEIDSQQSAQRLMRSVEISRELGDIELEADALGTLAWGQHIWGLEREAMERARSAGRLYDDLDKRLQSLEALDTQVVGALGCGELAVAADGIDEALARFERAAIEAPDHPGLSILDQVLAGFGKHAQDWVAKSLERSDGPPPKDEAEREARERDRQRTLERGFRLAGMFKSRELLRAMASNRHGEMAAGERAIRSRLEESSVEWEARLAARIESLHRAPTPGEMTTFIADLESARKRHEDLRGELARVVGESLRDSVPPRAALHEVRQALPVDGLLVEFVCGNEELYAYAVDSREIRFLELGPSQDWQQAVQEFVAGLCGEAIQTIWRDSTRREGLLAQSELRARGERLYAGLLAPILGTSRPTHHELVIVPSGYLCALPFEALTVPADPAAAPSDPSSRPRYLIEEAAVAYAPSTPVLIELAKLAERRRTVWPPTALLIADPDYGDERLAAADGVTRGGRSSGSLAALPRLDSSRDEVCVIAGRLRTLWPETSPLDADAILRIQQGKERGSSDSWVVPGAELYVGANATRARFLERSGSFSLLHVAAHGFADVQDPSQGCLVLSWDAQSEGRVTARDILARGLTADLTVLAACQTAIGQDAPHEGVLSLSRAFLHAGSRAVVASLWSANDLLTSELMQRFYEEYLDRRLPAPAALREAKLYLLRRPAVRGAPPRNERAPSQARKTTTADPYYWAPYVYFGLPR